ncbi:PO24 protein, partial [Pitta sordida]|nr:PO24 protein [Pitta sordida]
TREFLARGRQEKSIKSFRHCQISTETCSCIISNCPIVQDTRIKRHNYICGMLTDVVKKNNWVVFQEPHTWDEKNELYKPDLIFVKDGKAYVVDVTVWYEYYRSLFNNKMKVAANEKVKKYEHLHQQVRELTSARDVTFVGFPLGARGKGCSRNFELLSVLGLSKSRQEKTA